MKSALLLFSLLGSTLLFSQNTPCLTGEAPADDCDFACMNCNINGFFGNSANYTASGNNFGFCGSISNDQWIAFVAQKPTATITLIPSNCQNGDGLQLALYSAEGCMDTPPIICNGGQTGGGNIPLTINAVMEVGKTYLLRIDGYINDFCDFTLVVTPASAVESAVFPTPPPIAGPTQVCPKAEFLYSIPLVNDGASAYVWTASGGATINGKTGPVVLDKASGGNQVLIRFGNFNSIISVKAVNNCGSGAVQTKQVALVTIPVTELPARNVCPKQYPITLPWGDVIATPVLGSKLYSKTLKSSLGCDSVVRITIIAAPTLQTNLGTKVLCEGDSLEVCGKYYRTPGAYSSTCTGWKGCDSIVQFIIARPQIDLKGGGSLNCFNGAVPLEVLNTNGSAIWKNQAGDVLGAGKTFTATEAGIYTLYWTESIGGKSCTNTRNITIKETDTLRLSVVPPATLTCAQTSVTLQATANMFADITWVGPSGFIATQTPVVVLYPGIYIVSATTIGGCTATQQIVVQQDIVSPTVSAEAAANCDGTISLNANTSTSAIISYEWAGPNAFSSLSKNTVASVAGIYTVTVTAANGCTASSAVLATFNSPSLLVAAGGGKITCANSGTVKLSLTVTTNQTISVSWVGPNGFSSNLPQPSVTLPGVYTVSVTNTITKCVGVDTAIVTGDASSFVVTATGGELNCLNTAVTLQANTGLTSAAYQWIGPGNFSDMTQNPLVTLPGIYMVIVTNLLNGCTATATATVLSNPDVIDVAIIGERTLTCARPALVLTASTAVPVSGTYQWSGPSGFTGTTAGISVNAPGLYQVSVTNANGCSGIASINIQTDVAIPTLSIDGHNIFCTQPTLLTALTNVAQANFNWVGPNGFASTQSQVTITIPGTYQVTVTNPANGCSNSSSTQIEKLNPAVIQSINSGVLTCVQTNVKLVPIMNLPINNYKWTGPNGFRDSIPEPVVSVPGTYQLFATGINGCTQEISYTVPVNTFPPGMQPTGGVLGCNPPVLTLHCTTTPVNSPLKWSGPYGFLSDIRNPVVQRSGNYSVTATNPTNGCTRSASVTVFDNGNAPQSFLNIEFIGAGRRRINCFTTATTPVFAWTGPSGFTSVEQSPIVITPGLYTVLVTDGITDCQSYESILLPAATSANGKVTGGRAAPTLGWSLYPNPSAGQVQLRYSGQEKPGQTTVTILDGAGRIVAMQQFSEGLDIEMDLSHLPQGLYRISLQSEWGVETKSLSIQY